MSEDHAALAWKALGWRVHDLGSTNGTWVDGRRLESGGAMGVERGSRIAFADPDDVWEVADAAAPPPIAVDVANGELVVGEGDLLAFPREDDPRIVVYRNPDGLWVRETPDGIAVPAANGEIVDAAGRLGRLLLPEEAAGTPPFHSLARVETISLRFEPSRDEERVALVIRTVTGREIRLEPREYFYFLLLLARQRLAEGDLPLEEQGWMEREAIERALRKPRDWIDTAVQRSRRRFQESGIVGFADVVQVRRGARRIGVAKLEVRTA